MSRRNWIALVALVAAVTLAIGAMRRHRAASGASAPNAPPLPPWPDNPVRYDCRGLAPQASPAPEAAGGVSRRFLHAARWYGVSALPCGPGLVLDRRSHGELAADLAAIERRAPTLSPFARAVLQNAAIGVARCARSVDPTGKQGPSPAQVADLVVHTRNVIRALALDPSELDALATASPSPLAAWNSSDPRNAPDVGAMTASSGVHAKASGFTRATRTPGPISGADAFYGDLIVVDRSGAARVVDIPALLVMRRREEEGLKVCFAELGDPDSYPVPTLRPVDLPEGPLSLPGIRCDRCHQRGKRLSESGAMLPAAVTDRAVADDVTTWYRALEK